MLKHQNAACLSLVPTLAAGIAIASFAMMGAARADDTVSKLGQVNVAPVESACGAPFTETFFSFDISWIDSRLHTYFLADRSHGGASNGDALMIDIDDPLAGPVFIKPPADDPFAGIRCDANAAFGGTPAAGRNELTGPNGVFTVSNGDGGDGRNDGKGHDDGKGRDNGKGQDHTEAWLGDGPADFTVGQHNLASDYTSDPCNSSVRVFDIKTRTQTDHINVGGCFRTDEGAFDPKDKVALFANPSEQAIPSPKAHHPLNDTPFITLISTKPGHKILKQINFDGKNGTFLADSGIEQAVYSPDTGLFYIAVPGNSAAPNDGVVAVIDPRNNHIHVVTNFPLTGCSPNGAALGPNFELLLGCGAGPEQVIDIRSGFLVSAISGTAGGCDEVAFNAGDEHFAGACTDTHPPIDNLDISNANPPALRQQINTGAAGAHSVASDPETVSDWMPMYQGLCGTGQACISVFGTGSSDNDLKQKMASMH